MHPTGAAQMQNNIEVRRCRVSVLNIYIYIYMYRPIRAYSFVKIKILILRSDRLNEYSKTSHQCVVKPYYLSKKSCLDLVLTQMSTHHKRLEKQLWIHGSCTT